ncbi:DUF742 domain-containing protein [Kineococcus gynurae]|uniref:DUF742 domain-containing protein n=1 Tax=Kineococcus gynurae TaxID=452979 RepID=A0ABV5LSD0_9ACTN
MTEVPETPAEFETGAVVRPYTLTGGRTRPAVELGYETLVEARTPPRAGMLPERRLILARTAHEFLSVAELSAHLALPVGVVRVVVGDLVEGGQVTVHTAARPTEATAQQLLESVLHGISAL